MGQQETTMTMATEEKGGGTLLRRMVLVFAAAALMAVMMTLSAMPAMAKNTGNQPPGPPEFSFGPDQNPTGKFVPSATVFHNTPSGVACVNVPNTDEVRGGGC